MAEYINDLDEALYGAAVSVFHDLEHIIGAEIIRYAPYASFNGDGYLGPNRPRPVLTAYEGYDGPMLDQTYWHDGNNWINCLTGEEWSEE